MEFQDTPASPSDYLPPRVTPVCTGCGRTPDLIEDIVAMAREDEMDPVAWVLAEEGTLNPRNNHFLCNECYIKAGMPAGADGHGGPGRWVAP